MARYTVSVRTSMSPEEAFDYMADLRNFAEWDPGVVSSERVEAARGSHASGSPDPPPLVRAVRPAPVTLAGDVPM